jgi:hypothetical protein
MTRTTNARVAGFTFLFYIAAGIASLALSGWSNATHVLSVLTSLSALVLGVTLFALTREQDPDLALLALTCRIIEAIPGDEGFGALFFAVGSTIFCWLLLRGRMIPVALAWLGLFASALLVVILFLERGGLFGAGSNWSSSATWVIWLPALLFEITLALWLLIKGVAPARQGV